MTSIASLSRQEKRDIAKGLGATLKARQAKGPPEEALDAFIAPLEDVASRLDTGVEGKAVANAARIAQLDRLEKADSDVDAWFRHHYYYIDTEARRRVGLFILAAIALRDAAFAGGLELVDAYIPVENQAARNAIAVIRQEQHAKTAQDIGLPAEWTTKWEAALNESDDAFNEVQKARQGASANVGVGSDAETDFVDLALRLKRYVQSRASRTDKAKIAEGVSLLAPLTDALAKDRAEAAARATRKKNEAKGSDAPGGAPPAGAPPEGAPPNG